MPDGAQVESGSGSKKISRREFLQGATLSILAAAAGGLSGCAYPVAAEPSRGKRETGVEPTTIPTSVPESQMESLKDLLTKEGVTPLFFEKEEEPSEPIFEHHSVGLANHQCKVETTLFSIHQRLFGNSRTWEDTFPGYVGRETTLKQGEVVELQADELLSLEELGGLKYGEFAKGIPVYDLTQSFNPMEDIKFLNETFTGNDRKKAEDFPDEEVLRRADIFVGKSVWDKFHQDYRISFVGDIARHLAYTNGELAKKDIHSIRLILGKVIIVDDAYCQEIDRKFLPGVPMGELGRGAQTWWPVHFDYREADNQAKRLYGGDIDISFWLLHELTGHALLRLWDWYLEDNQGGSVGKVGAIDRYGKQVSFNTRDVPSLDFPHDWLMGDCVDASDHYRPVLSKLSIIAIKALERLGIKRTEDAYSYWLDRAFALENLSTAEVGHFAIELKDRNTGKPVDADVYLVGCDSDNQASLASGIGIFEFAKLYNAGKYYVDTPLVSVSTGREGLAFIPANAIAGYVRDARGVEVPGFGKNFALLIVRRDLNEPRPPAMIPYSSLDFFIAKNQAEDGKIPKITVEIY